MSSSPESAPYARNVPPARNEELLTPNRSAGRIEGELWEAFPAECQRRGVSNTDGMRMMIRAWAGIPEPASKAQAAGSAVDVLSR